MSVLYLGNGIFPEEVVVQILARLPIKPLFRFKSVCKLWQKLVSDEYFIQLYNSMSLENPMALVEVFRSLNVDESSYICVDRLRGVSEFSLEFLKDRVEVKASCNGLLCCASIPKKGVYYVCNPMTRQYRLLPRTREGPVTRFPSDDEATHVGLAYDSSTLTFKVVLARFHRRFGRRPSGSFICLVFDSYTNAWKRPLSSQTDEFTRMDNTQVVYANGSLHWLTYCSSHILALDLNSFEWRKILLPKKVGRARYRLLELDGSVSVIQIVESWMTTWVMKDFKGEEWRVMDSVCLICTRASRGRVSNVCPISQNGEFIFVATQSQILMYHRTSRVWKGIYFAKDISSYPLYYSAYAFRGTIAPCHQGEEYS